MPNRKSRLGGTIFCIAVLAAGGYTVLAAPEGHAGHAGHIAPIVAGYETLSAAKFADQALLGEVLLGELSCTSCHTLPADNKHVVTKGGPDLTTVGARVTPQYLRKFITDPHGTKPGTTMPDIFHASDPAARDGAVENLLHFLVSQGGPIAASSAAADSAMIDSGRKLFHSIGCVACHSPEQAIDSKLPAVPLPNLAMKTTVEQLAAFLIDPIKVRPGGRMPSLHLNGDEALAIATYLLRDQLTNPQNKDAAPVRALGLKYQQYEGGWNTIPDFATLKPTFTGKSMTVTTELKSVKSGDQSFGLRFTGQIEIPKDGAWTFWTKSDDGSKLAIDGKVVVDNDGIHAPSEKEGKVTLTEGVHAIRVDFIQGNGGHELAAYWQGPGVNRQPIPAKVFTNEPVQPMVPLDSDVLPFVLEPSKAAQGGQMFMAMGCISCHKVKPQPQDIAFKNRGKPLAELAVDSAEGCLGDKVKKGLPNYHLAAGQRAAIKAAMKNVAGFAKAPEPKAQVIATLARLNCIACHVRDGLGGPDQAHNALFKMTAEVDIGDEGRLPPKLTGVGAKLKPGALNKIVNLGQLHVRPTMATRMPYFGEANVAGLLTALPAADGAKEPGEFKASDMQLKNGRTLAGVKGLACVTCHGVNGAKSLGMPAPDLGTGFERLRPEWFHALLSNPQAINPGTRMPLFFDKGKSPVKEIDGGDAEAQIASLYGYLSLGKSMPLPAGMQSTGSDYELVPGAEPIVHRTYFTNVDRAILAGFPELVHVGFDQGVPAMFMAWRGRFFDAAGMWKDRGGNHLGPLGTDVIEFPGPALAVLEKPDAAWPKQKDRFDRNIGGKFHGYRLDKERRPIFMYRFGDVKIEEQPLPLLKVGGSQLERKFALTGNAPNLYLIAYRGKAVVAEKDSFVIDGKVTVKITGDAGKPIVRDSADNKEVLVPVQFKNSAATIEVEYTW
jgi:mono/diheme cytochrome c family protein